jgi:hypothetical protein
MGRGRTTTSPHQPGGFQRRCNICCPRFGGLLHEVNNLISRLGLHSVDLRRCGAFGFVAQSLIDSPELADPTIVRNAKKGHKGKFFIQFSFSFPGFTVPNRSPIVQPPVEVWRGGNSKMKFAFLLVGVTLSLVFSRLERTAVQLAQPRYPEEFLGRNHMEATRGWFVP